jgi:hypothetical protein
MPSLASAKLYRDCIGIDCLQICQLPRVPGLHHIQQTAGVFYILLLWFEVNFNEREDRDTQRKTMKFKKMLQ